MEAFAAVAGQLAAVTTAVRNDLGGGNAQVAMQGDLHGTLADVRFLVKGLNLLMVRARDWQRISVLAASAECSA
jgi:hypothetical protein